MYVIISNPSNNICTLETRKLITLEDFYKISLANVNYNIRAYTDQKTIDILISIFGVHSIIGNEDLFDTLMLQYQKNYIKRIVNDLQKSSMDKIKYDARVIEVKLEYEDKYDDLQIKIENLLDIEYQFQFIKTKKLVPDIESLIYSYINYNLLYDNNSYIPAYTVDVYFKITTEKTNFYDNVASVGVFKEFYYHKEDKKHFGALLKFIKDLKLNDYDTIYIKKIYWKL